MVGPRISFLLRKFLPGNLQRSPPSPCILSKLRLFQHIPLEKRGLHEGRAQLRNDWFVSHISKQLFDPNVVPSRGTKIGMMSCFQPLMTYFGSRILRLPILISIWKHLWTFESHVEWSEKLERDPLRLKSQTAVRLGRLTTKLIQTAMQTKDSRGGSVEGLWRLGRASNFLENWSGCI